ncbi:MAG: transglycosylase SLT domain-containing protein, partial [Muribaculaceae bacterium]|nr:transglycosylase SLT domain-containing protein [Muribaculaceae bacterium]
MNIAKILAGFVIAAATPSAVTAGTAAGILDLSTQITDTAIVFPESYQTDVHRMQQNWYLRNYTALDTSVSASVAATDKVITERLTAMPTTIEMPFNQVVRSHIDLYMDRRRSLVETMLGMSLYYMPIFEEALEREGLPLELRYLPIIESALNPDAVSRVGATGLWQFMLATARGLGLEVNTLVDERRDPIRSSEMAAKYLRQLYNIYNDCSLAIAAYN